MASANQVPNKYLPMETSRPVSPERKPALPHFGAKIGATNPPLPPPPVTATAFMGQAQLFAQQMALQMAPRPTVANLGKPEVNSVGRTTVLSVDEIVARYEEWKPKDSDAEASGRGHRTTNIDDKEIVAQFPHVIFLRKRSLDGSEGPILGALCGFCREQIANYGFQQVEGSLKSSKMCFINRPYANMRRLKEKLRDHELGDRSRVKDPAKKATYITATIMSQAKKTLDQIRHETCLGMHSPKSLHMRMLVDDFERRKTDESGYFRAVTQ